MADPTHMIGNGGMDGATRNPLTPSKKGDGLDAPENIISNITQARSLYYIVRSEHLPRVVLYASIEGMLAGNPPYSPGELVNAKLNHISNFNPLDARAIYERSALAYWNALYETETLVQFIIRDPDPETVAFADTMAAHFSDLVREWESFYTQTNFLTSQIVKFGLSSVIFPDERDWRWRAIDISKFYVPDQAQSDIAQLTYVFVETTFTVQYLYEIWSQFKDKPKGDSPWDCDELESLLLLRANSLPKTDANVADMMDLQRRLQNGDAAYMPLMTDSIRLISLLYTEYDGKVSHYIFDPYYGQEFAFFADKQYSCLKEALVIFTASPGEGTLHSNIGVGHKIYSAAQAMMMLDCSIVDMARYASTPLIKSAGTGGREFEQIRFYPGVPTNIGMNEFAQGNFGANIPGLIQASQYLLQKINYNAANSGDDPGLPDKNKGSVSPAEVRQQSYKEFGLPKNNLAHFYSQFDSVYKNMVVKMLRSKEGYPGYETAKEWKRRCIKDGVPEVIFEYNGNYEDSYGMPPNLSVCASRVAGDGSTFGRLMSLQELATLGIVSDMAPEQLYEYKREGILAASGRTYLKAFLPDKRQVQMENNGASVAQLENNTMMQGMAPLFSAANDHRAHIGAHFAAANQMLQMLTQQQTDAVTADKLFSQLIPHTGQHIQALSRSAFAKNFLDGIKKPWDQIQQQAALIRKNAVSMKEAAIKKQQEDAAKTQEAMSDAQRKDFTAKADASRADFKVKSQVERAKEASDTRAQIQKDGARSKAETEKLKVELTADAQKGNPKDNKNAELDATPIADLRADLSNQQGTTPSIFDFE